MSIPDTVSQVPRAFQPQETLDRIAPWLQKAGVTRLADITGLDNIGIPVFTSVRPDSASLSVDCGKGVSKIWAKCSAAMEALERFGCDELPIESFKQKVFPSFEIRFPRVLNSVMPEVMDWTAAEEWATGKEVIVPYYCVALYSKDVPLTEKCYAVSTNGLASGNTKLEAIASALFEVIERDAVHIASRKCRTQKTELPRFDCDSSQDSFAIEAIGKIRAAGCELFSYSCESNIGIPTFLSLIVDRESGNGLYKGYGSHLSPDIALNRSICEAAQARCVILGGARDDILWSHHRQIIEDTNKINWFENLSSFPIDTYRDDFEDRSTGSAKGDIDAVVSILQEKKIPFPIFSEFPVPENAPFSVVKVLVPTLEGYFSLHGVESGDRCQKQ